MAVVTKNRAASLRRCLASLALIEDVVARVLVVDDGSDEPVDEATAGAPPSLRPRLHVIRQDAGQGYIVGRNTMMRLAATEFVLGLDDDAFLVDGDAVRGAVALLAAHPRIAAVALAQCDAKGVRWPATMQPASVSEACCVATFIGFAQVLRRPLFVELEGYPEAFVFYGEEKDYCLRALEAGYGVVYLPDAVVAHAADPAGRDVRRYLRFVIRNDCLFGIRNEPLPMLLVTLPVRLRRYFVMRAQSGVADPGGFRWILRTLLAALPGILRQRKPVRWATIRRWHRLSREWPRFASEQPASASPPDGA